MENSVACSIRVLLMWRPGKWLYETVSLPLKSQWVPCQPNAPPAATAGLRPKLGLPGSPPPHLWFFNDLGHSTAMGKQFLHLPHPQSNRVTKKKRDLVLAPEEKLDRPYMNLTLPSESSVSSLAQCRW